jgi:AbrB family looped-hinge helix DNA binding protein
LRGDKRKKWRQAEAAQNGRLYFGYGARRMRRKWEILFIFLQFICLCDNIQVRSKKQEAGSTKRAVREDGMEYTIKLTSKGQITLPKEIREQLLLKFGDHLLAQVKEGCIVLMPKRGQDDNMILMEYAEQYGTESAGLKKVRERTAGLGLNMTEYVRKTREEDR